MTTLGSVRALTMQKSQMCMLKETGMNHRKLKNVDLFRVMGLDVFYLNFHFNIVPIFLQDIKIKTINTGI